MDTRIPKSAMKALSESRVLLVGCGSVGATMADKLVRSGLNNIRLVDPDIVEEPNVQRGIYRYNQVGLPKVEALSDHLTSISRTAAPYPVQGKIESIGINMNAFDLVICAADSISAQRSVAYSAWQANRWVVFVGCFKGGDGFEINWQLNGLTPCFLCQNKQRFDMEGNTANRSVNYGTTRLDAEVALPHHIGIASDMGGKIAIGLIEILKNGDTSENFMLEAIKKNYSMMIGSLKPKFLHFPKIFKKTSGQHTLQSTWHQVDNDCNCELCGNQK